MLDGPTLGVLQTVRCGRIEKKASSMPFILSVAMRGTKAQQAHDAFNLMAGNAAFRLVGIRLRGERMHLQPLAQHIAKMAAALRR